MPTPPTLPTYDPEGRPAIELMGQESAPASSEPYPSAWVIFAPRGRERTTIETAAGAAYGASLTEFDPLLRQRIPLAAVERARVDGGIDGVGPTGMQLVPCFTLVSEAAVTSADWVPLDGGSQSAGGPALSMATTGHRVSAGRALHDDA